MKTMENSYDSKDPQSIPVLSPFVYFQSAPQNKKSQGLPDCTQDILCKEQIALEELNELQCSSKVRILLKFSSYPRI